MGRKVISPEKTREIRGFILKKGDELSNDDIALAMGVSVSTISKERVVLNKPAIHKSGFSSQSPDKTDAVARVSMIKSAMAGKLSLTWLRTPFNGDMSSVTPVPDIIELLNP